MTTRDYPGDGITVHWDSGVCIHSRVCWESLPAVFRPTDKPWVVVDAASADEVAAVVDTCPSGALRYTRTQPSTSPAQEPAMTTPDESAVPEVVVTVGENGPYEVKGPVRVLRADGTVMRDSERLFLCRCGHSASKPFCDGSHKREGFSDDGLGVTRS
jgi:uncharacterized Fe-S cluster protein YjdI/CDGSH-type Zn-finger protein